MLAPLARALRLSDAEVAHLYRVAGHAEPGSGRINRHLTPGVQRVLDRLGDVPVVVVDPAWEIVAVNPIARALIGESGGNIARRVFSGEPSRFERDAAEQARLEAEAVADLHDALGRYPEDEAAAAPGRGPAAREPALRRAVGAAAGRGAGGATARRSTTPRRGGSPSTATS